MVSFIERLNLFPEVSKKIKSIKVSIFMRHKYMIFLS